MLVKKIGGKALRENIPVEGHSLVNGRAGRGAGLNPGNRFVRPRGNA